MGYENKYDLMDKDVFPPASIYIDKDNPKSDASKRVRVDKSDEEIAAAVTAEMVDSLGVGLEP